MDRGWKSPGSEMHRSSSVGAGCQAEGGWSRGWVRAGLEWAPLELCSRCSSGSAGFQSAGRAGAVGGVGGTVRVAGAVGKSEGTVWARGGGERGQCGLAGAGAGYRVPTLGTAWFSRPRIFLASCREVWAGRGQGHGPPLKSSRSPRECNLSHRSLLLWGLWRYLLTPAYPTAPLSLLLGQPHPCPSPAGMSPPMPTRFLGQATPVVPTGSVAVCPA